MNDRYVVGVSPIPTWCRGNLMQYRKADGSCGFELTNRHFETTRVYQLYAGDVLLRRDGYIEIIRKPREEG